MRKYHLFLLVPFFCSVMVFHSRSEQQTGQDYPFQPVPFTQVHFADTFWLPRMKTNTESTIPFAFRKCEETGRIENFKAAGKLSAKEWTGDFGFNDSDVYKVIEGASYSLMVAKNPEMDKLLDDIIGYIAAAQEKDGYLYTAYTCKVREKGLKVNCCYHKERWDDLGGAHELYNLGHMYEGAVAHYQATGKRSFLDVAIKSADLVCDVFGPGKNEGIPGHQEIEIGLVKLYRATGNRKYLDQAKIFLERRGQKPGGEYAQTHKPLLQQDEAVGHAVRATYMYSGIADVAALTGNDAFLKTIDTIWNNVVGKKLYITGGVGATGHGEAYGKNYELPNETAYCETCAAIANVYWNHRMFLLHGNAKYIDVMERSLYNGVISGVSLDGMLFFYPNPLQSRNGHDRQPWFGCACCPSNISRFLASIPGYAYAVRNACIYVNMFAKGDANIQLSGGKLLVSQENDYPWNGSIKITVTPERKTRNFALYIRVPGWAQNVPVPSDLYKFHDTNPEQVTFTMNSKSITPEIRDGYAVIERKWKENDTVTMNLPMPVRRITSHPEVLEDIGKVALQRGPVVYCIEWPDVEGGKVLNLMLKDDADLSFEQHADLLGGVTVLKGSAVELSRNPDNVNEFKETNRKFEAIPYYAWAHRGRGQMAVWIPNSSESAYRPPVPTIASESKVSTSFQTGTHNAVLSMINDQKLPRNSGDESTGFFHWWPHLGTTEWVQYDFKKPTEVGKVSVFWFDDTGRGACRIPQSWKVFYRDGSEWKPVQSFTDYKVEIDNLNTISFTPVKSDALRLEVILQKNFSGGIHEWNIE